MKLRSLLVLLLSLITTYSCNKETYSPKNQKVDVETKVLESLSIEACAGNEDLAPKVDVLFLVDNSGSTSFLTKDFISGWSSLASRISNQFNSRIVVAPLTGSFPSASELQVISEIPVQGFRNTGINTVNFKFPVSNQSAERAFERSENLHEIYKFRLFRKDAYRILVVISSEDDDDYTPGPTIWDPPLEDRFFARYLQLRRKSFDYWIPFPTPASFTVQKINGITLPYINSPQRFNSPMVRFFSIVPHRKEGGVCSGSSVRIGERYRQMSKDLYSVSGANDQDARPFPDSYDLCTEDYLEVFDTINKTIQNAVIAYKYNFWKISSTGNIDLSKIKVQKYLGVNLLSNIKPAVGNAPSTGYRYLPEQRNNQPIRYEPDPGSLSENPDNYDSGYFIQLFGKDRLSYPECLKVETTEPPDYYSSVVSQIKPDVNNIRIKKNGVLLKKSQTDGWFFSETQEFETVNIRATGPGNATPLDSPPFKPAIVRQGYIIRLYGNGVYSNNDVMEITIKPEPR